MKYFEAIRIHFEEFKRDIENYSRELLYKELPVLSEEKFLLYENNRNTIKKKILNL